MDKIAVLIPCYNESMTIGKVVGDFRRVLPEAVIYVYDNNSTDGTAQIAQEAGAVVRHEFRQGKGNVIRRMFREIDAEAYVLVDGDDTYPAENAPEATLARGPEVYPVESVSQLAAHLRGEDQQLFNIMEKTRQGEPFPLESTFEALFIWCQGLLQRL